MIIRVHGVIEESIVDGPGIRYVVFMQGCNHNCAGCHNPETHSIDGGYLLDTQKIIDYIRVNPLIKGVTFSGGEPMLHAKVLSKFADEILATGKDIVIFTGFTFEYITKNLDMLDFAKKSCIIVDGKFEIEQKSMLLNFRGSENQRVIDVKKTLESNKIILSSYH